MKITGNTILITGGATGIGFGIAEALLAKGNEVIICGRREDVLAEAKQNLPMVHTICCDVSNKEDRKALKETLLKDFPKFNMLINNAGMQRYINFNTDIENILADDDQIAINFDAPVQLCAMLLPHLKEQSEAMIMNVTSGLAFVPLALTPVYCATKAALHSFTMSLRHQLKNTNVKVFELIPPMVDTKLDRGARDAHAMEYRGIHVDEVTIATMNGLENDELEIAVGQAADLKKSAGLASVIFDKMNAGR